MDSLSASHSSSVSKPSDVAPQGAEEIPMELAKTRRAMSEAIIDRSMTLEIVRVTERAAIAASGWRGKGDEKAADAAAVEGMRAELDQVRIRGRIVIGEGERDEAP